MGFALSEGMLPPLLLLLTLLLAAEPARADQAPELISSYEQQNFPSLPNLVVPENAPQIGSIFLGAREYERQPLRGLLDASGLTVKVSLASGLIPVQYKLSQGAYTLLVAPPYGEKGEARIPFMVGPPASTDFRAGTAELSSFHESDPALFVARAMVAEIVYTPDPTVLPFLPVLDFGKEPWRIENGKAIVERRVACEDTGARTLELRPLLLGSTVSVPPSTLKMAYPGCATLTSSSCSASLAAPVSSGGRVPFATFAILLAARICRKRRLRTNARLLLLLPSFFFFVGSAHAADDRCELVDHLTQIHFPSSPGFTVPANAPFVGSSFIANSTYAPDAAIQASGTIVRVAVEGLISVDGSLAEGDYALFVEDASDPSQLPKPLSIPFVVGPPQPKVFQEGSVALSSVDELLTNARSNADVSCDMMVAKISYVPHASLLPFLSVVDFGDQPWIIRDGKAVLEHRVWCDESGADRTITIRPKLLGESNSNIPPNTLTVHFPPCPTGSSSCSASPQTNTGFLFSFAVLTFAGAAGFRKRRKE